MGFWLSLALGFIPALACAFLLYWLDRYEKEPKALLGGVFLWGAFFATVVAAIAQVVLQAVTHLASGSASVAEVAGLTLFAPVTEELLKAAAVFLVFRRRRAEFDSILDGVIYAGVVALGFAATENTVYLYSGYLANGGDGLLGVFILRVPLGIWNHPLYTSFFGIGLAIYRLSRRRLVAALAPFAGLSLAVGAHSVHNGLLTISAGRWAVAAILIDWLGWLFLALLVIWAARSEGRLLAAELYAERDAGALSAEQFHTASSSLRRLFALLRGVRRRRLRETRLFYQACAELAHKKNQITRVGEEAGTAATISRLREEIRQLGRSALA